MRKRSLMALAVSVCGASLAFGPTVVGCGSDDGSTFNDGGTGGDGSDLGDGDFTSADGSDFGDTGVINTDSGLNACATDTQKGTLLPLDLFIMLDTSGSMYNLIAAGTSKYTAVKSALNTFVNDPGSAGIGVGLQFFPLIQAGEPNPCNSGSTCTAGAGDVCFLGVCQSTLAFGITPCAVKTDCPLGNGDKCLPYGTCSGNPNTLCFNSGSSCGTDANNFSLGTCSAAVTSSTCSKGDSCNAPDYANPAVAIAPLPGSAAAISGALNAKNPNGNTPTSAALQGAINQAKAYATANPTHTVVAVLATDGIPTECDTNVDNIANIAQTGVQGTPSVKTYVIGVFTTQEQSTAKPALDKIASKGGTSQALIVTANSNTSTAFLQAMNQIRGQSLPCEFLLPKPEAGTPDYGKVNVQFTQGNGNVQVFSYVQNAAGCDPTTGGWYYDVDPSKGGTPTKVELCPASCNAVKADSKGKVDVVQGCKTVIPGVK